MTKTIDGVPFIVASPSFYSLAVSHAGDASLDVSFLSPGRWLLHMVRHGVKSSAYYPTRDAALLAITSQFNYANEA